MKQIKIAPSMLAADASKFGEELIKIEKAGADYVHIDVMDGHFVPNLAFSYDMVRMLKGITNLVFDVHLMISDPMKYIKNFVDAGSDIITFHHEAVDDPEAVVDYIHSLGIKAGVSVKPGTNIDVIAPYIEKLDLVLVMTVEPGFGGQSYITEMNEKIAKARKMIDDCGCDIELEVDGGITPQNIHMSYENGADVFVAGSAVFKAPDAAEAIAGMRKVAQ